MPSYQTYVYLAFLSVIIILGQWLQKPSPSGANKKPSMADLVMPMVKTYWNTTFLVSSEMVCCER